MYILGLATMTESSAVLMQDGRVLAAAEEERFTRVKHYTGFPYQAVQYVLASQGLRLDEVDHVAVYWNPYKLGHRMRYLATMLLRDPRRFADNVQRATTVWGNARGEDSGWSTLFTVRQKLQARFGVAPPRVRFFDHHAAHMASTFYASPFPESAILVMDGAGEAACTTSGVGREATMTTLDEHLLPHSLGHFYSSITGYLGFQMLDGEYKVMGLSPYGDPSGAAWIRSRFLCTTGPGRYRLQTEALDYVRALRGNFTGEFQRQFGTPRAPTEGAALEDRHRDVAASAQRAFEEVVIDVARELRLRTGLRRLTIAGGCGLNCTVNGRLLRDGIFDELYVPPVPHDAGGALGAAMLQYVALTGRRPEPITHAQFGPDCSEAAIAAALSQAHGLAAERLPTTALIDRAAHTLAQGQLVAWVQGRMEYGPRALGNRSLLADPRSEAIREVINAKIKKRELFRPFAPSVKAERAADYFDLRQPSPFMTIAVPVRSEKRAIIPAVTHVDGTARVQTVERAEHLTYWSLLDRFEQLTGVPVLLNTSFNVQEPIVCTPAEALATFGASGIDAMAIGDYWVVRR